MIASVVTDPAQPCLRVPNAMTRPGVLPSLAAIGLYAQIQSLLLWEKRVPTALNCTGGLRAKAGRMCRDGQIRFDRAWRQLQAAGLLKGIRYSYDHNKFRVFYELLAVPDTTVPSMRCIAKAQLSSVWDNRRYAPRPSTGYLTVSQDMLNDKSLALAEKGLYIVVAELAKVEQLVADGEEMLKRRVRDICTEDGTGVIHSAWHRLKIANYLHQQRTFYRHSGRFCYLYQLTGKPEILHLPEIASNAPAKSVREQDTHVARTAPEKAIVAAQVAANVQADRLRERFPAESVEELLRIMRSTVCTRSATVSVGGHRLPAQTVREKLLAIDFDRAAAVLAQMQNRDGVRQREAYILTLLVAPTAPATRPAPTATPGTASGLDIEEYERHLLNYVPVA